VIIDTSVLVAIVKREPGYRAYLDAVAAPNPRLFSAASYVEASIIIDQSPDPVVRGALDELLRELEIEIVAVTVEQARIAREAYRNYGRGSGHPARLNFGDCFAYALARERNEPLLYKGGDFGQTDIPLVGRRDERHRLSELLAQYGMESAGAG
jgi:ribonuclease VapC